MATARSMDPASRDRSVTTVRVVGWTAGIAAAGLAAALSVAAAHAFKGHDGRVHARARATTHAGAPRRSAHAARRLAVPPPQDVPAIAGAPAELQPPPEPPAAAAPLPAPAPVQTSGGS